MNGTDSETYAQPRVAAGVLYTDRVGRPMLVNPTYKDLWEIPGGYVHPGETPSQASRREIIEALGTALPVGPLLIPRLARRLNAAIDARAEGETVYFEHGAPAVDRALDRG